MKVLRTVALLFLLLGIATLTLILIKEKTQPPFAYSLSPLFQVMGKPVQSINRAVGSLYPINAIDEKMLGEEIKQRYLEYSQSYSSNEQAIVKYLQSLVFFATIESTKPFDYTVFLVEGSPNAFACPGGVICVTKGLLAILESEAELMAILGHEIGHIERGHLFDAARGEMLRRKIQEYSLAHYALDAMQLLTSLTFSKTQENEADEYGFRLLLKLEYDPFAISTAFEKLKHGSTQTITDPLHDFFASHPHTEARIEKFHSLAKKIQAKEGHPKSYIGKKNFTQLTTKQESTYPDEFR